MGEANHREERDSCHIRPGLVAIPAGVEGIGSSIASNQGLVEADQLEELIAPGEDIERQAPPIDDDRPEGEEIIRLEDLVSILKVEDPHEAARVLNDQGIAASPIHAVGFESHGGVMNGIDPVETKPVTPPGHAEPEGVVAVVDSGIVSLDRLPPWMQDGVRFTEDDVEEPDTSYAVPTSHGTFVASLYRQIAPGFIVSLAAARPHRARSDTLKPDPGSGLAIPTDELQVLDAVVRLVNRHALDRNSIKALNLSLGAYKCGDCSATDNYLLLLRTAVNEWRRHFGRNATIFAAGGNTFDSRPVYPAAFPCVRGVGALERGNDQQVVWDNGQTHDAPHRRWIDDVAIGQDLEGLSGQDPEHSVRWSGSSFATARAGAKYVSNQEFVQVFDGITWWDRT